jgi:hypothetical protein
MERVDNFKRIGWTTSTGIRRVTTSSSIATASAMLRPCQRAGRASRPRTLSLSFPPDVRTFG